MKVVDAEQRPTYGTNTPYGPPPGRRRPVRRSFRTPLLVLILIVALLLAAAWAYTGTVRHQSASIPASGIRNAMVTLNMGAGSMEVSGTAAPGKAVEANFTYNTAGVTWDESHFNGALTLAVGQKSEIVNPFNMKNDWTIRLGQRMPVDLRVNNGAGEARLDLRRVDLRSLEVNGGAGAVRIDLRQSWRSSLNVTVHGGVGETTIDVPTSVGVLVHVHAGLGSTEATGLVQRDGNYVNERYGRSPVTLHISVDQGVGTVNLRTG